MTYKGQAVPNGTITFIPASGPTATGELGPDGSYTLTRRDKGAFTTIGGASPGSCDTTGNHGTTVAAGVKGKMAGYIRGKVTGGGGTPAIPSSVGGVAPSSK